MGTGSHNSTRDNGPNGGTLNSAQKIWQRVRGLLPSEGFHFDHPLVLLQSDDWGRVGLRDQEGLKELQSAGIALGERPYDFHTLESAEDLSALRDRLQSHRDSTGRPASMEMNFIVANPDFARVEAENFQQPHLLPLAEGLPRGWSRPGLLEAYREGIREGLFHPSLHGRTHFCHAAVERQLVHPGERLDLLRIFWRAGTPYIYWRMPWVGYEYWDPEQPAEERFLTADCQGELIGQSVGMFAKTFSALPRSACAPGYRSDENTHQAWARYGVRVVQSGPRNFGVPHFDRFNLLHLYRTVEFEPAIDPAFSVAACLRAAEDCFARGIPAIVCTHSINFHSSVRDFRTRTLEFLNEFLSALKSRHPDVLYLHDENVRELIDRGWYETSYGVTRVRVTKERFTRARVAHSGQA